MVCLVMQQMRPINDNILYHNFKNVQSAVVGTVTELPAVHFSLTSCGISVTTGAKSLNSR